MTSWTHWDPPPEMPMRVQPSGSHYVVMDNRGRPMAQGGRVLVENAARQFAEEFDTPLPAGLGPSGETAAQPEDASPPEPEPSRPAAPVQGSFLDLMD